MQVRVLGAAGALAAIGLATAASAQSVPATGAQAAAAAPQTAAAPIAPATSWEHAGSDIPADPVWVTGTLPNGLNYAVRKNRIPVGRIAIRLRIGVGGLMETPEQQGWSHLLEHMLFRGTKDYPDGEAIKIWQRLGASFGKDTNASTSPTATTLKLDLPKADAASYDQALAIMAGMVRNATIDPALLDTERKVVIAERELRISPVMRKVQDASKATFFAGLTAGDRELGGTDASLANATSAALKAYYHRWYRPDRATVVVVGDADPAMLVAGIKKAFGDWQGIGPAPAKPDFGAIAVPAAPAAVVVDPQAPDLINLAWMHPHDDSPITIARVQEQLVNDLAVAIIGQRLSTAAQQGKAIVNANVAYARQRDIADHLAISITPQAGEWKAALDQTFAVLNRLLATPPSQAEIDQHAATIAERLRRSVDARQTETSSKLANTFMQDVDIGDVTPKRSFYSALFDALRPTLTPDRVAKAIAEQLAPDPRMVLLSPKTVEGGQQAAVAALAAARRVAAATSQSLRPVSLDELKTPDTPGRVVATRTIADLGIHRVTFANGVELDYKKTPFEKGTIRVQVEIGHGLYNRPPGDPGLYWTSGALTAAGIGPFTPDELTRLVAGRRIGFSIQPQESALAMATHTNQDDLADAMKLMVGALTQMRYAETPIERLKNSYAATYQAYFAAPGTVLQAFGAPYLHGGDARFRGVPPTEDVAALTLAKFRAFWQQQLAQGPIRVLAVGDLDPDALIAAVARSFGALPPRPDTSPSAADLAVTAVWDGPKPVILHHKGDPNQAAVAMIYPTTGVLADVPESIAIDIAASIIQDRLIQGFRETQGASYTPFADSAQSADLPDYGLVMVGAQLDTRRIGDFYTALDGIVADLAAHGPSADELARAVHTKQAAAARALTTNSYWLSRMSGNLDDPRYVDAVRQIQGDIGKIGAADVQAAAKRWLAGNDRAYKIEALPEVKGAQ